METFSTIKEFVDNPDFESQRTKALKKLNFNNIDKPIVELIQQTNELSYCFTLQCCYGHFLYTNQNDSHNLEPIPESTEIEEVEYRIAYIALCIQDNLKGHELFDALKDIVKLDPDNIQFGCADWFWKQHVNTYVLQVEPDRYKYFDKVNLDYKESLHIESIRNQFFKELNVIISEEV